jgi:serine/threonine-protein kinase
VDIVDQIAAGLAAAHARGIVHRDLKPDNIFLVPVEGRATELVKILDFGISKVSWGLDANDGEICGTPQYMAPEQVEGRVADVDGASDQFALAVIAYELLTGRNPFVADSVQAIFTRVARAVVPPTGISSEVDAVLARALARSNAERFPSVMDFAAAFRLATLAPPPVALALVPSPAPVACAPRRPSRRRPGWGRRLALSVAVGVAATSFVGGLSANRVAAPVATWSAPAVEAPPAGAPAEVKLEQPGRERILATSATAIAAPLGRAREQRPAVARARARRQARPKLAVVQQAASAPLSQREPAVSVAADADADATLPPSDPSVGD